jgi:hypothetical protein
VRETPLTDGAPVIVGTAAPAVRVCEEAVTFSGSGAAPIVKLNVRELEPDIFVAVIVYVVADCTVVGVPVSNPVDVLNDIPAGADGEKEKVAASPVFATV